MEQLLALHPYPQQFAKDRRIERLWIFELPCTPETLWPHIADTSRMNRALGTAEMTFEERDGKRWGFSRPGGVRHEWWEVPWNWVANQWLTCTRIYTRGFMKVMYAIHRLEPTATGTRVYLYFGAVPRGLFGSLAIKLGFPGLEPATEAALFEKMKDKELMNAAALAIIIGGSEEGAARAVAMFSEVSKEALDELKDFYFDSFGFWSDDDLAKGRLFRFVANAESIGKVRVKDTLQDWAKLRLGAQFNNLEYDSGPHSMTRVTLRYRLGEIAKKGDANAKKGAIETLKFMKEQGALMALRDEKSDTGVLAKKALFELQNPKTIVGEKVPEKKATGPEGMKVVAPK